MSLLHRWAFVPILLICGAPVVAAQLPTPRPATATMTLNDSAVAQGFNAMATQMGPMYENMMQAMMDGTLKAMAKQENIDRMAAIARQYYEALIKQGFTKDEALQIVTGLGMPLVRGR